MQEVFAMMIFVGLSFSGFVTLMNKGATLREMTFQKILNYALIVTVVNVTAVLAGYGISVIFEGLLSEGVKITAAYLVLFFLGIFFTVGGFFRRNAEEKLDKDFDNYECFRLALRFSWAFLLVGAGCFMIGVHVIPCLLVTGILSMAFSLGALQTGYTQGPGFSRIVSISGGVLMIVFTVLRFLSYLSDRW